MKALLKEGKRGFFETWWKMLLYVYETPTQCADDVSTVLGVSVVNELPDILFLFFFLPYPLYLPSIVDTKLTRGSNCISPDHNRLSVAQHCTAALDSFFLIALSSVGFVCRAIMWSDLHLGNFLGNGYWVVTLSTVVCPLPPNVIILLMYVL